MTRKEVLIRLAKSNLEEWSLVSADPGLFQRLAVSQLREAGMHEEAAAVRYVPMAPRAFERVPVVPSGGDPPRVIRLKGHGDRISRQVVASELMPDGVTFAHQRWKGGPWELTGPASDVPISVWSEEEMLKGGLRP